MSKNKRTIPLREVFDGSAQYYDEVRPGYPEELVEDIIRISGLPDSGRILEVGCGTGQATKPFAQRGYEMLCLDIGVELLKIARKKFQGYHKVKFLNVSFEEWKPETATFDLLISATAFHWIDPEIGYSQAAKILRENGFIALFWNMHPSPYTDFFVDAQKIYRKVVPEWGNPVLSPSTEERIKQIKEKMDPFNLFREFEIRIYPWTRKYSTSQYLKLLETYSDHKSLEENRQRTLYKGISDIIENNYGGFVERPYLTVLYIAQKIE
jgi:SAM-dependent methyltransferase